MNKLKLKTGKLFFLSLLIFTFLSSSGCFDVRIEVKMYPNGTGYEEIFVTLDADFYSNLQNLASIDNTGKWKKKLDSLNDDYLIEKRITTDVERTPGTSIKDLKVTSKENGSKEIYLQFFFDEPEVIGNICRELLYDYSNQTPVIFTTIKFLYDEGDLTYKHVTRKAERYIDDELMKSVFASSFSSRYINYTIEFPFDVNETNALIRSGNTLTWDMSIETALSGQQTDTAALTKDPALELTYAEKIDHTIGKVSQKENPLVRVQVYNRNKEPVKIGTGIVVKDNAKTGTTLVTNFELMNIIGGAGFFSIILQSDSLAGIDEMTENDLDVKQDLVFLRFGSPDRYKLLKFASFSGAKYGNKVKIFYYPNTLSSVVYAMDGMVSGTKKWTKKTSVIEIKPAKPLSLDGGAVFNEAGEFLGMISKAYDGEVGKLYIIPAEYIRGQIP